MGARAVYRRPRHTYTWIWGIDKPIHAARNDTLRLARLAPAVLPKLSYGAPRSDTYPRVFLTEPHMTPTWLRNRLGFPVAPSACSGFSKAPSTFFSAQVSIVPTLWRSRALVGPDLPRPQKAVPRHEILAASLRLPLMASGSPGSTRHLQDLPSGSPYSPRSPRVQPRTGQDDPSVRQ